MQDESNSKTFDVLIVGYGPAGATAANLIARRGYRVAVIEQAMEIYDKPRAITADQEVMRVFQECGLANVIEPTTIPHPGTDFVGVDGQIIKRFDPQPPPYQLSWEATWMFVQPELEQILRSGVAKCANVSVFLGYQVVSATQTDNHVRLEVKRLLDGAMMEFAGSYALGCDGARSTLRDVLSSRIDDLEFDEWWIVIDTWKRGEVVLPKRVTQYCRPSRPGSFIVGPRDLRRWEVKMLPGETPDTFADKAKVLEVLSEFVPDVAALEISRIAIYRFHALVVEDWQNGRIMLVGDAAHQMPPFLGQGLCAAIRDVYNLTWKIDAVERLGADRHILSSYGEERKPHVRTVVEHAKEFGLIIGELDLQSALKRDQHLKELLGSGEVETVRQKFIPGLTTGLIDCDSNGRPKKGAGILFVQPWVQQSDGAWHRLDDLIGPRFALVSNDLQSTSSLDLWTKEMWSRLEGVEVVILPPEQDVSVVPGKIICSERENVFGNWFEQLGGKIAVVRPDRYVYGIANTGGELSELLQGLVSAVFNRPIRDRRVASIHSS